MATHATGTPAAVARGATRREWLEASVLLAAARPDSEAAEAAAELRIGRERHLVLGTHRVERLETDDFLGVVGQERSFDLAVFQGHSHRNAIQEIAGIGYCMLAAMVAGEAPESNAYAVLRIAGDGSIHGQGFRLQQGYDWPA